MERGRSAAAKPAVGGPDIVPDQGTPDSCPR